MSEPNFSHGAVAKGLLKGHRPKKQLTIFYVSLLLLLIFSCNSFAWSSGAWGNSLGGWLGFLGSPLEQDVPGSTNPYMPLLFPPYFAAEVRITPTWLGVGTNSVIRLGDNIRNLQKDGEGIGLSSKGSYVEFMARMQFSRLSLRGHYYAYVREIPANNGSMDWLNWRIGADLDVFNMYGVRFGPTIDYNLDRPKLTYNNITNITGVNSGTVDGYAPGTLGLFVSYNPMWSLVVTPSFEFRYRWPFPYRSGESLRAQTAQVTEGEFALGLKLPPTRAMGTFGFRFGYRDTILEFGGSSSHQSGAEVKLNTYGNFVEFVWFY